MAPPPGFLVGAAFFEISWRADWTASQSSSGAGVNHKNAHQNSGQIGGIYPNSSLSPPREWGASNAPAKSGLAPRGPVSASAEPATILPWRRRDAALLAAPALGYRRTGDEGVSTDAFGR